MHYKNGEEAKLGDIVQHDTGHVGIVIGGTIGSNYCSTHVVFFKKTGNDWGARGGAGYVGTLVDSTNKLVATASVAVALDQAAQTRELIKIGHIDIGHG